MTTGRWRHERQLLRPSARVRGKRAGVPRRLTALDGVTVWVGSQGWWPEGPEFVRPKGWPTLDPGDNEARLTTFQEYRDALCLNTGMPVAVVDVDPDNGGDIEKVRALLARLGVRIFAEVDTPGGGKHFYVAGHPDLVSTHSTADNQMLPGFPGVDVQSFGCNVFLPGTLRPKHDGRGYTNRRPGRADPGGAVARGRRRVAQSSRQPRDAAVARRGQADRSHGLRLAAGDRRG